MKLFKSKAPVIITAYACGHEQREDALNFTGRGWCEACQAEQIVVTTRAGWI